MSQKRDAFGGSLDRPIGPLIKKDMKKDRLLKGIEYFKNIKPSDFNAAHALHLKVFLNLLEEYLNGEKDDLKEEREIFKDVI